MSDSSSVPDKFAHLLRAAENKPKYVRAITPRLRVVLYIVFGLFGILSANGAYLSSITFLEWWRGEQYQDHFYQLMMLVHLALGLLLITPVVFFGILHMLKARGRRNKRAVQIGYALFAISIAILVTGLLLMRVGRLVIVNPDFRAVIYWAHIAAPLAAVWLYWLHRLAGPKIKWREGGRVAMVIGAAILAMVAFQASDPRVSAGLAPKDGAKYFHPSLASTASGKFIDASTLMNDDYCLKCHPDVYKSWFHSAHHLSSFNNPAYLASVRETRRVAFERDKNVQATRWCAGCHDPVPFFSGAFDDPNYDDVAHPTSQVGITCTVCHAIQSVGSTRGNSDYVIDEPEHYPFTYSKNPILQKLNEMMVLAKPAFHKSEMLKPFHKSEDFCSVCHKVSLPGELTKYREWMRGQNHHDTYLLSGVSGHGARSFYYPPVAEDNCNGCHMPQMASNDFGAKFSEKLGTLAVKDHLFVGANTALPYWYHGEPAIEQTQKFLKECMRVDIFGVREGGVIEGQLTAPLRPTVPSLKRGESYLLETVSRTLKLGHHFTQGTTDSNNVWLDVRVTDGDGKLIGASGQEEADGSVDPWSHFVNNFVVDKRGDRINRRNAQDIFTTLYNHQIPPGAGQTVHYRLRVPEDAVGPITVKVQLKYRKFDTEYLRIIENQQTERDPKLRGQGDGSNPLPVTMMCEDTVVFGLDGDEPLAENANPMRDIPQWQRWNDYGIGMLLKGKGALKQAAEAFAQVEALDRFDGPLNLARVMIEEGDLDKATEALGRSLQFDPPPPPWTYAWLSGVVDRQQGNLESAATSLRGVLETKVPERKFDFSLDYVVRNELGLTLFDLAQFAKNVDDQETYRARLNEAEAEFLRVLQTDSENSTAHANLARIYGELENQEKALYHSTLHQKYKTDDNASEIAIPPARQKYPAADHAAESLVIYDLQREAVQPEPDSSAANGTGTPAASSVAAED